MKNVLIVDDDTIIRITLRSLIDWESMGFHIVADAIHGEQALEYLVDNRVDLVITDMKMPVMDGIGLLEAMNNQKLVPKVLVLSGYDDFKLVREAFRLGASDYLLKADLTSETLVSMMERFNLEGWSETGGSNEPIDEKVSEPILLVEMAMGKRPVREDLFQQPYLVVQFEIEDFSKHLARFGENYEDELIRPMLEFAGQIPRVVSRCVLGAISPSHYLMLYRVSESGQYRENVVSACKQLMNVWNHYMNLPVSAGISSLGDGPDDFLDRFEESGDMLKLRYLKGKAKLSYPWEPKTVKIEETIKTGERYKRLLNALTVADDMVVQEEKQRLFVDFYTMGLEASREICFHLVCNIAWILQENHDDIYSLFTEEMDYYQKIGRLDEIRNLELWINNYFRWITDYTEHNQDRRQADLMMRAKRFIMDNYANPELTLGSVAGYVGLNEKYFSSRFTKEEGTTFSNYLTEVRIRKARELMEQTNLKIYEISQNVGYNSVEHFTRVFKKIYKVSPGSYRK